MTPHSAPPPLLPARDLGAALSRAQREKSRAVAIMVTAAHCPWCGLVIEEQLIPRIRSRTGPSLDVVVFDIADSQTVLVLQPETRPDTGGTERPGPLAKPSPTTLRFTPARWAESHGYRVAPTVVMVGRDAGPLFPPLVGYSSRDFYGAYLDDQVVRAHRYWSQTA
ncbi:MAG: hypothetical protein ACO3DD_08215 [Burkholderiaceae bacterium]